MNENCMEILSKGRYEEQDNVVHSPSTTPDIMARPLSLTRLPSTEPYFVLSDGDKSLDQDGTASSTVRDTRTSTECKSTSAHAVSETYSGGKKNGGGKGEESETREQKFYSWMQSRTGSMEALLKSYISTHYGLRSAGKRVEDTTDEESEEGEMQHGGDEASVSNLDRGYTGGSGEELTDDVSLPLTAEKSSGHLELADLTSQRFADPLTQKAYEKMLALDERLVKAVKREKEVKRQRRLLEERMLQEEGITLALIDGLSKGTDAGSCVSPLFPTQPSESQGSIKRTQDLASKVTESSRDSNEQGPTKSEEETRKGKKMRKVDSQEYTEIDFIKRNIELVTDAGSLVKMTNAEKQRLKELLDDEDEVELEENKEVDGTDNDADMYSVRPTLEIMDRPFAMDVTALERLREIHSKLGDLSASKEIGAICCSPTSVTSTPIATSKSRDSTFVSESTSEYTPHLSMFGDRGTVQEGTVHENDNGQRGESNSINSFRNEEGGDKESGCGQEWEETLDSNASSACDEGDVVLVCMETADKENQDADTADDDCDVDCAGGGSSGDIDQSSSRMASGCAKCGVPTEHDAILDEGHEVSSRTSGASDPSGLCGFTGDICRGNLARACLSVEEREKMYLVDEKLRQLRDKSDAEYLCKMPLSSTQLKLLLDQCKDSGRTDD